MTVRAGLGDLMSDLRLRGVDAAPLLVKGQSTPTRTAAGTEVVIDWYAITRRDGSEEWPLDTPLRSRFLSGAALVPETTRLSAFGDLEAVTDAVRAAIDAGSGAEGEANDSGGSRKAEVRQGQEAIAASGAAGSSLGAATQADGRQDGTGAAGTTATSAGTGAAPEAQGYGVSRDGCGYRIDLAAAVAVVQTRTVANGRPAGDCTDSFDRVALQRDHAACRASLSAETAVLAYKLYFQEGGNRRYVSDCTPDPARTVEMSRVYDACPEVVSGQGAYRAYRLAYVDGAGARQWATECAADTAQALPVARDYAACAPEVDSQAGTLRRAYLLVYTALDGTPKQIGGCTVDTTETVALDRSYAGCDELVNRGEVRRQYRYTYSDRSGAAIEVGACRPDLESAGLVPTSRDYVECEAVLDLQAGTVGWAYRATFVDRSGTTRVVRDCALDPASVRELSRDFSACSALVDAAAGTVRRQYQAVYVDRQGALRKVGDCRPDPAGTVTLQADYAACEVEVDGIQGLRWHRYRPYFEEGAERVFTGECRRDDAGPLPLERSYQGCAELVDAADETVHRQFRYRYTARTGEIVTVGECRADETPSGAVTVQLDSTACSPVVDGEMGARWDQARPYYMSHAAGKTWIAPCRPVDAPPVALQKSFEVCDELVSGDGETVTAQYRYQYTDRFGTIVPVGDCQPDSGPGAFVALHADMSVCTPVVDLQAGTLRRQAQAWYWTAERTRRQVGECAPVEGAVEALGQDYGGCTVQVDEAAGTVRRASRATWIDHQGARQYGPDCAPDLSSAGLVPLTRAYEGCDAVIHQEAAQVWVSYRRAYEDGNGEVQAFGACIEDRSQPVPLSRDYAACEDRIELGEGRVFQRHQRVYVAGATTVAVGDCQEDPTDQVALQSGDPTCLAVIDIDAMRAWRQHRRYYNDRIGQTRYVDADCLVDAGHAGWELTFDADRCSVQVDLVEMIARARLELVYTDDADRRVVVEDCAVREDGEAWPIDWERGACGYRHDVDAGVSWAQHRPGYSRAEERVQVGPCEDSEDSYPHLETREGCVPLVDLQSGTAYARQRTAFLDDEELVGVTGCDPDLGSVQDLQKAVDACEERTDDFDTATSFAWTRWYHTLDGHPAYVTDCAEDLSVSYQHLFETTAWSNNDTTRESTELRVTYIEPPGGRVDIAPAAILPNSTTLPYTFSRSEDRQNGGWTSDGCSVFWQTDRHEIYLRRDGTEADYVAGAGTPEGPTNGCTYTTESGHRYYHRGFETSAYLTWNSLGEAWGTQWAAAHICGDQGCVTNSNSVGNGPCVSPCTNFFTGNSPAIDNALDHCRVYPAYDPSTGTSWHRSPRACGLSIMRQTRQVTTFPDGSRAYGPWIDTGQVDWLDLPIQLK
ncbi:MAG: hypothetical protein RIB84_00970 [Sneathiellaceae bacterium]